MLTRSIARVVELSIRRPWLTIVLALALAIAAGVYTARHFAIHTDINDLISPELPWAKRAQAFAKVFPQRDIVVVLDGPTPEIADQAAAKLIAALTAHPERFKTVSHPGSGPFFDQNGLLFLPTEQVKRLTEAMGRADDLIGTLAADPSLRGTLDALSLVLIGVERKELTLDDAARAMNMASDTVEAVLANRPATFSWRALVSGKPATPSDLRRFILVEPVLDFTALEPGRAATDLIAQLAAPLQNQQVRVRQTGTIPIDDDEFGTIQEHAGLNATLMVIAVVIILWFALHSFRIILAVAVSLAVGLAVSTAVGLMLVSALNLISVAFFVLFVGLGVDFGIQFSVRYRAERHDYPDLRTALRSAALKVGGPLALAAAATAVGFSSFLPTSYRGLSELGQIAGVGMIIAFIASVTILPALLAILNPPGEPHAVGFTFLAPVDRFLERHRIAVVVGTIAVVVLASPLLFHLPFDFDPQHLRNPTVESMSTYLELRKDPETGANAIEVATPNLQAADAMAQRLAKLPEVGATRTLSNLIPGDQDAKLDLIHKAAAAIDPSLNPDKTEAPPSDKENVDSLTATADSLTKIAGNASGPGADAAKRLAGLLTQLAKADPSARQRAEAAIVDPLKITLDQLRAELKAQRVTAENIPPDIARDWVAQDGQARVEVLPKGDPDDTATLRTFVLAVLAAAPEATGPGVLLYEAGETVVHAFVTAGIFALCAIAVLLFIALRRIVDVLLTLVPLLVAGAVTLELCVVLGLPLNFANIIALPLLLGVGVAFKIYYIVAWRAGKTRLLESTLTRAVIFSAMTTATAFGSLWLSSHPGTSSMGKLMALALACTMTAAVLFQPALMGPPREKEKT